ncbi:MAG: hypothetical protein IKM07_01275 [Clostridia bacterium]|nr:hypothetical protein [Clostridia bacterium]
MIMMKSFTVGVAAGVIAGACIAAAAMPKRRHCHVRAAAANALHTMGDAMDHAGRMVYR